MSRLAEVSPREMRTAATAAVRSALDKCNIQPIRVPPGRDIKHEGDRATTLYLVESGWLYSYCLLADGRRQIVLLHQPGDVIGLADLSGERSICSLRSLQHCVIHPVPTSALSAPSFLTSGVATFLLRKAAEAQAIFARTLVAVGRMDARNRVVWLMLMLHDRRDVDVGISERGEIATDTLIDMPLNQTEIGDLLGLSNVSVSKTLCQLSEEGYIERQGSTIVLRRLADMKRMVDYADLDFEPNVLFQSSRSRIIDTIASSVPEVTQTPKATLSSK